MIVEPEKLTSTNADGLTEVYYLPFKWNIAHLDIIRRRSLNFTIELRLEFWGDIFCKHQIARRHNMPFEHFLFQSKISYT